MIRHLISIYILHVQIFYIDGKHIYVHKHTHTDPNVRNVLSEHHNLSTLCTVMPFNGPPCCNMWLSVYCTRLAELSGPKAEGGTGDPS